MTAQLYDSRGLLKREGECIPQMVSVQVYGDSRSNQAPQVSFSTLCLAQRSSRDGGLCRRAMLGTCGGTAPSPPAPQCTQLEQSIPGFVKSTGTCRTPPPTPSELLHSQRNKEASPEVMS